MSEQQLIAGLIAHSLLFSIGHENPNGSKARAKLANAFKKKFLPMRKSNKSYDDIINKASDVFKASWAEIPDKTAVSISNVVHFMVIQNPIWFKPYKINLKHLQSLNRASNVTGLTLPSLKVAKSLASKI